MITREDLTLQLRYPKLGYSIGQLTAVGAGAEAALSPGIPLILAVEPDSALLIWTAQLTSYAEAADQVEVRSVSLKVDYSADLGATFPYTQLIPINFGGLMTRLGGNAMNSNWITYNPVLFMPRDALSLAGGIANRFRLNYVLRVINRDIVARNVTANSTWFYSVMAQADLFTVVGGQRPDRTFRG